MPPKTNPAASTPSEEPAWKQRAVERSTKTARLRAEQRVERFLDAAQALIAERGTTDFTVQEVVDRSHQSLRSFYQHFNGKHELLLALFEDAMRRSADQIRAAAADQASPLDGLKVAVELLFELCRPDPTVDRPLFSDFAPQLLISHPVEVRSAYVPMLTLYTELMTDAAEAGQVRLNLKPRRAAALTMQTAVFLARASGTNEVDAVHPVTAAEIWEFCARGFARI